MWEEVVRIYGTSEIHINFLTATPIFLSSMQMIDASYKHGNNC